MKHKLTIAIAIPLIATNLYAREPVGINDQLVDKETGKPLIVLPQSPAIDMSQFNLQPTPVTQVQAPQIQAQPNLPVIDLSGSNTSNTNTSAVQHDIPQIKHWRCIWDQRNVCNQVEMAIFYSGNAELINLDNQLNEGWVYLTQNHPNLPILTTRLEWVTQRDSLGLQILQQHGKGTAIDWLIQQYKARVKQLDDLNLIPKAQPKAQ